MSDDTINRNNPPPQAGRGAGQSQPIPHVTSSAAELVSSSGDTILRLTLGKFDVVEFPDEGEDPQLCSFSRGNEDPARSA